MLDRLVSRDLAYALVLATNPPTHSHTIPTSIAHLGSLSLLYLLDFCYRRGYRGTICTPHIDPV